MEHSNRHTTSYCKSKQISFLSIADTYTFLYEHVLHGIDEEEREGSLFWRPPWIYVQAFGCAHKKCLSHSQRISQSSPAKREWEREREREREVQAAAHKSGDMTAPSYIPKKSLSSLREREKGNPEPCKVKAGNPGSSPVQKAHFPPSRLAPFKCFPVSF